MEHDDVVQQKPQHFTCLLLLSGTTNHNIGSSSTDQGRLDRLDPVLLSIIEHSIWHEGQYVWGFEKYIYEIRNGIPNPLVEFTAKSFPIPIQCFFFCRIIDFYFL